MARLTKTEKVGTEYFSHRLEVRRIWLEKFLLAAIIGLAVFTGNYLIEDYKADLTISRFLLESRLEGLKKIRSAYNECSVCMTKLFKPDSKTTKEETVALYGRYQKDLYNFNKVLNEWSMLFPDHFSRTLACHNYIHDSIAYKNIVLDKRHASFVQSIYQHFDYFTRVALVEDTLGGKEKPIAGMFVFDEESVKGLSKLNAIEFFNINFKKWEKENKQKVKTQ